MAISSTHFFFADLVKPTSSLHQLHPPARLAVLGSPTTHSKSPKIHNEYIKKLRLPWTYVAINVQLQELAASFELLWKSNFIGFNVTVPYKKEALKLINEMTDHARLLGAINTVVIKNGQFFGHNTDGPGFVAALKEEWNISLQDRSILILGATGGAGSALAMQSAIEGCGQLFLSSRTPSSLQEQVQQLLQVRPHLRVKVMGCDETSLERAMSQVSLIVNATPVGFLDADASSLIPSKFFQPHHYVYDIVYSEKPTPLMKSAQAGGAHTSDGSSMLRLQGAIAFNIWIENQSIPFMNEF